MSIPVLDQEQALEFYTETLGFIKKVDMPVSETSRWITLVPPEDQDGPELLLEPAPLHFEPAKVFQKELHNSGIPWCQLYVDNVQEEYDRLLAKGVKFSVEPTEFGAVKVVVFDDTCGNHIQLVEQL